VTNGKKSFSGYSGMMMPFAEVMIELPNPRHSFSVSTPPQSELGEPLVVKSGGEANIMPPMRIP
jgi:hypothetical protein